LHISVFISLVLNVEFDEIIMLWIREHQKDVHFVTRAKPTIDKLRNHFVMADERKVLDFRHMLKVSRLLSSRFQGFKEHKISSLCACLVTAREDSSTRPHMDLADLLHQHLQMSDKEIIEFKKIYGLINPKEQNSAALAERLKTKIAAKS